MIKTELYNRVYDLLVHIGGASEDLRSSFLHNHTVSKDACTEWRFCGRLGFGGKFRSQSFTVDCYKEDETPERVKIIADINTALEGLKPKLFSWWKWE